MSKLYIQEAQEQLEENIEVINIGKRNETEEHNQSAENLFMKRIQEDHKKLDFPQKKVSLAEKIEQYLLNYGNQRYNNQYLKNSFDEDKTSMFWKFFGILIFASVASTAINKTTNITQATPNQANYNEKATVFHNIVLDSLNYDTLIDTNEIKTQLEKDLGINSPYKVNILKNELHFSMGEEDKIQLIPKGNGSIITISYSSISAIGDTITLSITGLDSSAEGKKEKSVWLSKMTEKNYPGYNVSIRMKTEDAMTISFMKKMSIPLLPRISMLMPLPIPESQPILKGTTNALPEIPTLPEVIISSKKTTNQNTREFGELKENEKKSILKPLSGGIKGDNIIFKQEKSN